MPGAPFISRSYLNPTDLIDVEANSLSPTFTRLCKRVGIKDLHFHDLRHTAATNLRRAGVDVFTIQKITGHKSLDMLKRYNTIDIDDLKKAVEKAWKVKR